MSLNIMKFKVASSYTLHIVTKVSPIISTVHYEIVCVYCRNKELYRKKALH